MSEYLTKEEVKQWRSSLEKITLEEFAHRLGKTTREEKRTSEIVDVVLSTTTTNRFTGDFAKKEKVVEIAKKSVNMQQKSKTIKKKSLKEMKSKLTFRKPLTEREDLVLNEFLQREGEIVFAKELAKVLTLPNDYVYKYIKNLRAKIEQDILINSASGGYKLVLK